MDRTQQRSVFGAARWIRPADYVDVELRRTDTLLQLNWVRNSPGKPISEDRFSAVWTGWIRPDSTAKYTFSLEADDAASLWIDEKKCIDTQQLENENAAEAMRQNGTPTHEASIQLEGGVFYPIRLTYHETVQNAHIRLSWRAGSGEQIPVGKKNLFAHRDLSKGDGLNAVYRSKQPNIVYTANQGNVYAVVFGWPGKSLQMMMSQPPRKMKVSLLPNKNSLPWRWKNGILTIDLGKSACPTGDDVDTWVFRMESVATP